MHSPNAVAHLSQSHHKILESSSAGCRSDSTQGKKARRRPERQTAAFILKILFREKDGLLPFVIAQDVGMFSWSEKTTLPCREGQAPRRLKSRRTVRDSPTASLNRKPSVRSKHSLWKHSKRHCWSQCLGFCTTTIQSSNRTANCLTLLK